MVQGLRPPSNARSADLIPGWGGKIPHALWPKTKTYKKALILKKMGVIDANTTTKKSYTSLLM